MSKRKRKRKRGRPRYFTSVSDVNSIDAPPSSKKLLKKKTKGWKDFTVEVNFIPMTRIEPRAVYWAYDAPVEGEKGDGGDEK